MWCCFFIPPHSAGVAESVKMQVRVYNEREALPYSRDRTGCVCLHADVPDRSGFQQNYMAIIFTNVDA